MERIFRRFFKQDTQDTVETVSKEVLFARKRIENLRDKIEEQGTSIGERLFVINSFENCPQEPVAVREEYRRGAAELRIRWGLNDPQFSISLINYNGTDHVIFEETKIPYTYVLSDWAKKIHS